MLKWSLTLTVSCISSSLLVTRRINNAGVGFAVTAATKADIFSSWVKSGGYTQAQCEEHFRQLKLEVLKHLKPLDPDWAAEERQRLVDKFKSRRSNAD